MVNPLKQLSVTGFKSPHDPQECCDWANARLHPDACAEGLHWAVTGNPEKPIALVKCVGDWRAEAA